MGDEIKINNLRGDQISIGGEGNLFVHGGQADLLGAVREVVRLVYASDCLPGDVAELARQAEAEVAKPDAPNLGKLGDIMRQIVVSGAADPAVTQAARAAGHTLGRSG